MLVAKPPTAEPAVSAVASTTIGSTAFQQDPGWYLRQEMSTSTSSIALGAAASSSVGGTAEYDPGRYLRQELTGQVCGPLAWCSVVQLVRCA